jgi:hypothetical protein
MADPLDKLTVREAIDQMRSNRLVPLGIVSYDLESESIVVTIFKGLDTEEVNAMLAKLNLRVRLE